MRAFFVLTIATLLSGCILRAEDARTNPFGLPEATSSTTNDEIYRMERGSARGIPDANRGCGGCS
jgi:hypothetical protein